MSGPLRVAVVGSGPAGAYAAGHLRDLGQNVRVDLLDRLVTPWGLVRAGVAPDHPETKGITRLFETIAGSGHVALNLNVEVGTHVTHGELLKYHHAVVYAVGASDGRRLGIPGEDLRGSHAATDFVGWYNGHPDFRDLSFDLDTERVVIVGNGNVALDVARLLTADVEALRQTDMAVHALDALARSRVREVVVLGRRSAAHTAFTTPELIALAEQPLDLAVDLGTNQTLRPVGGTFAERSKVALLNEIAARQPRPDRRRIVLRFLTSPLEVVGEESVTGLRVCGNATAGQNEATRHEEVLTTSLVLRAIGYRGRPIPGVPFDHVSGTIPNVAGRVLENEQGALVPGVYVTGWAKRGPSGVIGTNKHCAYETIRALLDDYEAGLLPEPVGGHASFSQLLSTRTDVVDVAGWRAIEAEERRRGSARGRARVKLVDPAEMVEAGLGVRAEAASVK